MGPDLDPATAPSIAKRALQRTQLVKQLRVLIALALLVPGLIYALYARRLHELEALADHGATTIAIVTEARGGTTYFVWEVGGKRYDFNVARATLPLPVGAQLPLLYLPESPSRCWSGPPLTPAVIEESCGALRYVALGFFAFFVLLVGVAARQLRVVSRGGVLKRRSPPSPRVVGRVIAALILAVMVGVELDPAVVAVQAKAFGAAPLGVPVRFFMMALVTLLFTPMWWVFEHLAGIVVHAQAEGGGVTKGEIIEAVLTLPARRPEFARSRAIVLAGLAYVVLLMGAWIAYAAHLGI